MISADAALSLGCGLCLWVAAWRDLRGFVIPNALSLALLALFLARATVLAPEEAAARALAGAAMLAGAFAMYLTGRLGAGDAKLLAAFTPHVPIALLSPYLFALAISGAASVAMLALMRRAMVSAEPQVAGDRAGPAGWAVWRERGRVPFGFAISAAGACALAAAAAL
ncbi:MAG: prepilin peptidase [Pseudomonadota bacterium]